MVTCFISDIHLGAEHPEIERRFLKFIAQLPGTVQSLHILGDLFDYWVGDDGAEALGFGPVLDALAQLVVNGVALHIMHGNRDFLLGNDFYRYTGAHAEEDPSVLSTGRHRVLLCHGDSLCTSDHQHQRTRQQTRDPLWQQQLLQKPLAERIALAHEARRISRHNVRNNAPQIMDVTASAVEDAFRQSQTQQMIHGHTHRPGRTVHEVDKKKCTRFTLGDWYEQSSALYMNEDGIAESLQALRDRKTT